MDRAQRLQKEYAEKHGITKTETKFKSKRNRRYYLHQKIKGLDGLILDSHGGTISTGPGLILLKNSA